MSGDKNVETVGVQSGEHELNWNYFLQVFHKQATHARAGDHVGVLLRGVKKEALRKHGLVLCGQSDDIRQTDAVMARFYVRTFEEGGRRKPITTNHISQVRRLLQLPLINNEWDGGFLARQVHSKRWKCSIAAWSVSVCKTVCVIPLLENLSSIVIDLVGMRRWRWETAVHAHAPVHSLIG